MAPTNTNKNIAERPYFYHSNHLGSSSWITNYLGTPVQSITYLPYGKEFINQQSKSYDAVYKFIGKERDSETGYDLLDNRYYSSDLGMFLSVDPMSDKYPMLTPYNYSANSPINLRDPNGMDFDPRLDKKNKTITIGATYYTANENRDKLQSALDAWNGQSDKYYFNPEGTKTEYTINFDLKIADGDFPTEQSAMDAFNSDKSGSANFYNVIAPESGDRGDCDGRQIRVRPDAPSRTSTHEVGHTLGIGEFDSGVMKSGGNGKTIHKNNVINSLNKAGFNAPYWHGPENEKGQKFGGGTPKQTHEMKGRVETY